MLEAPIPQYSAKDPAHRRLAALGAKAASKVAEYTKSGDLPPSLARRRAAARQLAAQELAEIDEIVGKLLA